EVLAVNIAESNIAVQSFVNKHELTFPILLDKDRQVLNAYGVGPLPTTFMINPEGEVIDITSGTLTERMIRDYMEQIKP
ncbi:redoxin domain-containing protein, partial [Bacillus sp. GbtcB15]